MWYLCWCQQAIFGPPLSVVYFHKWSDQPYVLAIRVMPFNWCECGLVGIRGRKWPRMWDMGFV